MARFEPYLVFDGKCKDAVPFYERSLGGKSETPRSAKRRTRCGRMAAASIV